MNQPWSEVKVLHNKFCYRVSPTITLKALRTLANRGYLQTIAKVEDVHTAKNVIPKTSKAQRERPTLNKLPSGTRDTYTKVIGPMACETSSALDPWESLCEEEHANVWNVIYETSEFPAHPGGTPAPIYELVKALVCNARYLLGLMLIF